MKRVSTLAIVALLAACGNDQPAPELRELDRPTDIAFTCWGGHRITGGGRTGQFEDPVVVAAQPLESCIVRSQGEVPLGQETLDEGGVAVPINPVPEYRGFVLQSSKGTVAPVDMSQGQLIDSDSLAPGINPIPVGTLPVGITADASGCFVVTANAGSCDLSVLDVSSALDPRSPTLLSRSPISNGLGDTIKAKPRAVHGYLPGGTVGQECPAQAEGHVYVAYPGCNVVAAVDAASGSVLAGVRFTENGSAEVIGDDFQCPDECGDGSLVPLGGSLDDDAGVGDDGAGEPIALELAPDGSKLFVGGQNSRQLAIVDLDEAGLPVAASTVVLEGSVGVSRIAVSEAIDFGGNLGGPSATGVEYTFAYLVATDGSIRVVDVEGARECDTQVDPRYLGDERNLATLGCFPVGAPETPPRRALARGPGIRLPGDALPLDLSIVSVVPEEVDARPSPNNMVGTFAFVTSANSSVYVVNIDDDNYPDFEDPDDATLVQLPLALAHTLRDFVAARDEVWTECTFADDSSAQLPPRQAEPFTQDIDSGALAEAKLALLPSLRTVECLVDNGIDIDQAPVTEMSLAAPADLRDQAFADLGALKNEQWNVTWEGSLSLDSSAVNIDGRQIRSGFFRVTDGAFSVEEAGGPFCGLGVEPYDIVQFWGCDPAAGNASCGIGETCFVHPDSPAAVSAGICLPDDQVSTLAASCREFLISKRRYTVSETAASRLSLEERRRTLRTTPLDGCVSDDECALLAVEEDRVAEPFQPNDPPLEARAADREWQCGADPSRAPGVDRCMMSCTANEQCEDGYVCSGGFCVGGVVPDDACFQSLQRYLVRAGDSFAVVGSSSGFLHGRTVDDAGMCVDDPDASPLLVGRIPLRAEPCTDGQAPNPCSTVVSQFEEARTYSLSGDQCVLDPDALRMRDSTAVRFSNPMLSFHMVDTEVQGDAVCIGDGASELPSYSPVFAGYRLAFRITGGLVGMFATADRYNAVFPARVERGPDGLLWVLDQGDASASTQGRVLTLNPNNAALGFEALFPIF